MRRINAAACASSVLAGAVWSGAALSRRVCDGKALLSCIVVSMIIECRARFGQRASSERRRAAL
jgi:hypothetical protein